MTTHARSTISPEGFKQIRERLGLSRDQFGVALGLVGSHQTNYRIIGEIESGKRNASMPMAKLAWMLGKHGLPVWPRELDCESILAEDDAAG